MTAPEPEPGSASGADAEAAAWVVRHERGLTAAEQDAFLAWIAANPQHRAAFAEQRWSWEQLDRLNGLETSPHAAPEGTSRAPARARPAGGRWRIVAPLAAAGIAVVAAVAFVNRPRPVVSVVASPALALCEVEKLADGSQVDLNRGAAITVQFAAAERRVRLDRGEAHFAVAKDPTRPFVVEVEGVAVRAVGTAFSVKRGVDSVAVLVTEGTVSVASPGLAHAAQPPLVTAGQKAVASLLPRAPATLIEAVAAAEMEDRLAWKPRLLEFDEAPLAEIAAEFNRCNPVRIEIAEPALRARRLTATLRSDNVEGFVRMLESDFDITVNRQPVGVIALRVRR